MAQRSLHQARYTLTSADMLVYEQAVQRTGWIVRTLMAIWVLLCAAAAFLMSADWVGPALSPSFFLIALLFAATGLVVGLLAQALWQWRAAQKRMPRPVSMSIELWPDHLIAATGGRKLKVPYRMIERTVLVRTHLFLLGKQTLILPRHAFADDRIIDSLLARIGKAERREPVDRLPMSA